MLRADSLTGEPRLHIDDGLLRAFLLVGEYIHGARSMEAIVQMSSLAGKPRYERSSLPAAQQLAVHVDAARFMALVQRVGDRRPPALGQCLRAAHHCRAPSLWALSLWAPSRRAAKRVGGVGTPPPGADRANNERQFTREGYAGHRHHQQSPSRRIAWQTGN